MDDAGLTGLAGFALATQLGALPFVWRGRRPRLLALVNLSVALPVLWVLLDRPWFATAPLDWPVLGMALFEVVAVISALTLAAEWRRVAWLGGAVFGVHLLLSLAALLSAALRMTRLI